MQDNVMAGLQFKWIGLAKQENVMLSGCAETSESNYGEYYLAVAMTLYL